MKLINSFIWTNQLSNLFAVNESRDGSIKNLIVNEQQQENKFFKKSITGLCSSLSYSPQDTIQKTMFR